MPRRRERTLARLPVSPFRAFRAFLEGEGIDDWQCPPGAAAREAGAEAAPGEAATGEPYPLGPAVAPPGGEPLLAQGLQLPPLPAPPGMEGVAPPFPGGLRLPPPPMPPWAEEGSCVFLPAPPSAAREEAAGAPSAAQSGPEFLFQPLPFPGAQVPVTGRFIPPEEAEKLVRLKGQGPFASAFDRHPTVSRGFRHAEQAGDKLLLAGFLGIRPDAMRPDRLSGTTLGSQGADARTLSGVAGIKREPGEPRRATVEEPTRSLEVKRRRATIFG